MPQHYDNAVKYVMLGYSQEFAEFMVGHSDIKVLETLETEQPTIKTHQNDSTLKVQLRNEIAIFHTEVQTDDSRKPMWSRLAGYNGFLIQQHEIPVYCNVLYLHPNAGKNDKGYYAYKGLGYEYVLRYKVIRLIEIEGQTILEKQMPGLLPFTPLMKPPEGIDANRWLEKCIDAIALASTDQNTKEILFAALGVFGSLVYDSQMIIQRLPEGIMRESPFIQYCLELYAEEYKQKAYTDGVEQGKAEGLEQGKAEGLEQGKAEGLEQGKVEGLEQGEKKGTIQSIIALLEMQFKPDAVKVLEPTLQRIDDMQRLRELLLVVPRVDSLEGFMQYLSNGNAIESENGGIPHS